MENLKHVLSRGSSLLPHRKVAVPCRLAPEMRMQVYMDSELSLPLGVAEPRTVQTFKSHISSGDVIFDIGAHIGTYSILAASVTNTTIHAFEPHPYNIKRLQENIKLNDIVDRVGIIESAVWKSDGEVKLTIGSNNTTHSVVKDAIPNETITVESISLNTYCEPNEITPDIVKVDVEGGGEGVVAGADRILSMSRPVWIVEYHTEHERKAFVSAFNHHNYDVAHINGRTIKAVPAGQR